MNSTLTVGIIAGAAALFGGFAVLRGVQSVRTRREYPGALLYWDEPAVESFSDDPGGRLAVLIHRVALVLTGAIAIVALLRHPSVQYAFSIASPWLGLLEGFIVACGVGLIGFTWGVSLFGPLAERLGGAHHYAISDEGLLLGGNLLPWSAFSHFTLKAERNVVYIWSATIAGAPGMVAAPSAPHAAEALAALLQQHLPSTEPLGQRHGGKWTLAIRMALLGAPFVALAGLLSIAPLMLMLLADAVLMWALQLLGAALIDRMLYGGQARPVLAMP